MQNKKSLFAIIGSASANSANLKLVEKVTAIADEIWDVFIYQDLKKLPHFDPENSLNNPPDEIIKLRKCIEDADAVIICTPEYVFSIPSGLKNAIEWCITTTIFSEKPCGLITASASGQKGHVELQLIMNTVMARFNQDTLLLIPGIKSKFDSAGNIIDPELIRSINKFIEALDALMKKS